MLNNAFAASAVALSAIPVPRRTTADLIASVRDQLLQMEYSDGPTNWDAKRDLRIELRKLEADAEAEEQRRSDDAQLAFTF